ncbi:MAG: type transport system ATP-binding protein, partial [Actinoplanes sp.]|nr:type transport system ATP-binding protein [Actinoplanes sp.]
MALTFIRLKLRVSANGLRGQTSRVVLLVLGAMLATGLAVGGWAGFAVPGLLGPNGAGKTTTLSMAVGLLRPDAGQAFLLGHDVWADPSAAKKLLGVLPDGVRLFDRLTGAELLAYHGLLRGMAAAVVDQRAKELLDVLELGAGNRTLIVDYSAGMRKKI